MRLYIQEKNSLIKYNLPAKVDGSLLYYFKSSVTGNVFKGQVQKSIDEFEDTIALICNRYITKLEGAEKQIVDNVVKTYKDNDSELSSRTKLTNKTIYDMNVSGVGIKK